jgi:Ca-activated chloride channel family protein
MKEVRQMKFTSKWGLKGMHGLLVLSLLLSVLLAACDLDNPGGSGTPTPGLGPKPDNALEVTMAYSSEKLPFIQPLAAAFNQARHTLPGDNRPIYINAEVVDSGTARTEIAAGRLKPTVWSPSGSIWKPVLNYEADRELAGESEPIFLTPVVIAMWKPMAEALGWPDKPLGLSDIIALNNNPEGWGSVGHPEWGKFKYAHTNPEVSTTGLSMVAMEFYAAAGKVRDLTEADLNNEAVKEYVQNIENSIVHYSATTTIFKDNVRRGGMDYISAVALEEVTVIELNKLGTMPVPLVSIYPKEGTFYHDNPFIILKGDWVTEEQRQAAVMFRDFLLLPENQKNALTLGFRPANPAVQMGAPFTADFGVDPTQPKTVLEVPQPRVLVSVKNLWGAYRKESNIFLVLDVSPSMDDQNKLSNALEGLKGFLEQIRDVDNIGFIVFGGRVEELVPLGSAAQNKPLILDYLNNPDRLPRPDSTAIYDGVAAAVDRLEALNDQERINAVVVLTDGQDNSSSNRNRGQLIRRLRENNTELNAIKVFPIAYGREDGVDTAVLQEMADATRTRMVSGDTSDIRRIYQEISLYF